MTMFFLISTHNEIAKSSISYNLLEQTPARQCRKHGCRTQFSFDMGGHWNMTHLTRVGFNTLRLYISLSYCRSDCVLMTAFVKWEVQPTTTFPTNVSSSRIRGRQTHFPLDMDGHDTTQLQLTIVE
jgi:hypothetical protein